MIDDFIVQIDRMHHTSDSDRLGLPHGIEVDVWLERASVTEPEPLLLEAAPGCGPTGRRTLSKPHRSTVTPARATSCTTASGC